MRVWIHMAFLSSVLSHACHTAAEASLSILFVPVTSGCGWMKLSAQEAWRLRWKVSFISYSWFYFSTRRRKSNQGAGEEEHEREEDWYRWERHELPATWASCSQFMNEADATVRRSEALTWWMELIVCVSAPGCRIVLLLWSEKKSWEEREKSMDNNSYAQGKG